MSISNSVDEPRATFTHLGESTLTDWQAIMHAMDSHKRALPDRVIKHLQLLAGDFGGFPIDRLHHCTQTATRAVDGGEDEEYVVCALLHDIGDTLGTFNHPELAATILQPFVSEANHWMVQQHGLFQGYYFFQHFGVDRNARDRLRDQPHYDRAERFVRLYDAPAFEPEYTTMPLSAFEPMIRRVFTQPKNSFYADLALREV
jgi:predicted HD phosphohydrolase